MIGFLKSDDCKAEKKNQRSIDEPIDFQSWLVSGTSHFQVSQPKKNSKNSVKKTNKQTKLI